MNPQAVIIAIKGIPEISVGKNSENLKIQLITGVSIQKRSPDITDKSAKARGLSLNSLKNNSEKRHNNGQWKKYCIVARKKKEYKILSARQNISTEKITRLNPNTQVNIIISGVTISTLGIKDSMNFPVISIAAIIAIITMFFAA